MYVRKNTLYMCLYVCLFSTIMREGGRDLLKYSCWTADQQAEPSILQLGHDAKQISSQ